ncbi:MAG: tetratricopeptide repeat protein [Gammaproteobacteria bacterium]|nr:tetratricopeptide repeat protein [Gammaproteobacteria bacterium]
MRLLTLVFVPLVFLAQNVYADLTSAQNLFQQGRSAEALAEVDAVLAQSPKDAEARFLKGIIYADLGQSNQAIEVFAGLTQDYPELPEPYNNLAVLFAEQGEFEKARDSLLAAIQTHPSYSTAHENLGDLYAKMAGIAYDRALEEDNANESARLKLSAVNGLFSAPVSMTNPVQVAVAEPEPVLTEPEPVVTEPEPEPEPEPVITEPEPEPEPVVAVITDPEPEPVITEPVTTTGNAADDIRDAIRDWASAWSSQDVDGYLRAYSRNFRPSNGAPLASWISYRRQRLSAPSFINVDVGEINVEMLDSDRARASFVQGYQSDNYQDQVVKTLTMSRTSDGWQIVTEVSEAL